MRVQLLLLHFDSTQSCTFLNTSMITAGTRHEFQAQHIGKPGLRTCNTYWNSIVSLIDSRVVVSPFTLIFSSLLLRKKRLVKFKEKSIFFSNCHSAILFINNVNVFLLCFFFVVISR